MMKNVMLKGFEQIKQMLWGTAERKAIGTNIYWLLLEKATRFLFGFLVGVWVVRYLGPEQFGIFSVAIAFCGILEPMVNLGVEKVLIRELVKHPENKSNLLTTCWLMNAVAAGVTYVVAIGVSYLLWPSDTQMILLVAIIGLTYVLVPFNIISIYFESRVQNQYVVRYHLVSLIISNLLKIYFILTEASLASFAWVIIVEKIVLTLGLLLLKRQRMTDFEWRWFIDRNLAKSVLKDSLPLMVASFMVLMYMRIDQIMLQEMVSNREVGLYGVAVTLTGVWLFVPIIITRSFFPKLVATMKANTVQFQQQLQRLYQLIALTGYVIAIPVTLFAGFLVRLLYGNHFEAAGPLLATLIWVSFAIGMGVVRNAYIYAMNLTKTLAIIAALSLILNICLNLLLIPHLQGLGAVLATLISQSFACIGANFIFPALRQNGFLMLKAMINPNIFGSSTI